MVGLGALDSTILVRIQAPEQGIILHLIERLRCFKIMMKKLRHQKDLNGCGIACLANLLDKSYDWVKKDFENKFYKIEKGIKV